MSVAFQHHRCPFCCRDSVGRMLIDHRAAQFSQPTGRPFPAVITVRVCPVGHRRWLDFESDLAERGAGVWSTVEPPHDHYGGRYLDVRP